MPPTARAAVDLHACLDGPMDHPRRGARWWCPRGWRWPCRRDTWGIVAVRSSMGIRRGITLSNAIGVIDSDYRGPLGVGLRNTTGEDYVLQPGDRMAQLLVVPVLRPEIHLVEALPETERGAGGFGSTGR